MAVALRLQSLDLPASKRSHFEVLRKKIRELKLVVEQVKGEEGSKALQSLIDLRREFRALIDEATPVKLSNPVAAARGLIPDGGALVIPIVSVAGGKILILQSNASYGQLSVIDVPDLTYTSVNRTLKAADGDGNMGWLDAFKIQYLPKVEREARWPEWNEKIETIGYDLWALFGGALVKALRDHDIKPGARVILMPAGPLGLLPIGLTRQGPDTPTLAESYELVSAPSLEALSAAERRAAENRGVSLAEIVNPTGDLPFTETEGALIASFFPASAQIKLDKTSAEPIRVLSALKARSYWHFSSHGAFDWAHPRESGLIMKNNQHLTIGRLLDEQTNLGQPRLVVLSACETGLYDIDHNPDEFVGLPATFMQLGAAGVVSTLWQVDDLATSFLMARFYELHLIEGFEPPTALKRAKEWLRSATKAELLSYAKLHAAKSQLKSVELAYLEKELKSRTRDGNARFAVSWQFIQEKTEAALKALGKIWNDDENMRSRPFERPYYWGAFVYTGL